MSQLLCLQNRSSFCIVAIVFENLLDSSSLLALFIPRLHPRSVADLNLITLLLSLKCMFAFGCVYKCLQNPIEICCASFVISFVKCWRILRDLLDVETRLSDGLDLQNMILLL